MVLHGASWVSWRIMVLPGFSWGFMVLMVRHGASWCSWCIMGLVGLCVKAAATSVVVLGNQASRKSADPARALPWLARSLARRSGDVTPLSAARSAIFFVSGVF